MKPTKSVPIALSAALIELPFAPRVSAPLPLQQGNAILRASQAYLESREIRERPRRCNRERNRNAIAQSGEKARK